jgi:hypothetical protein
VARDVSPDVTSSCVVFFVPSFYVICSFFVCLCTCAGLLCIADIFAVKTTALNGIEVHCNFGTCKFRLILWNWPPLDS